MVRRLLRDPLTHFLVAGLGIFALYAWVNDSNLFHDPRQDDATIRVDRKALLEFMQYRLKAFQPELVAPKFDALAYRERKRLIQDYVREEVLYREGLKLGLDRNDYVIKQRIIQRVRFGLRGLVEDASRLSEDDLKAWYQNHLQDYRLEPSITFTHVFFSTDLHNREAALNLATDMLAQLRHNRVPFSEAGNYGERFPYHTNYVERDRDYVAAQFGNSMTDAIFALDPKTDDWFGPFQSPYGFHLVKVTRITQPGTAALETIRQQVADDARQAHINKLLEENIRDLIQSYQIELSPGITSDVPTP